PCQPAQICTFPKLIAAYHVLHRLEPKGFESNPFGSNEGPNSEVIKKQKAP
ncbi:hypothetical protein BSGG_5341, partial [Bacteroides sp. D2]